MHVFRVLRPALGKLGDGLPVYGPILTQSWLDTADSANARPGPGQHKKPERARAGR